MTPAERSLLLTVAKHLADPLCERGNAEGFGLYTFIYAVEDEFKRAEQEEFASCATCDEYERVHDHDCGLDGRMRGSDDLCGEWRPRDD